MSTLTLLGGAAFAAAASGVYLYVGSTLAKRRVSPDAQLAATLFSVWWMALALTTLIGGAQALAAAAGVTPLAVYVTLTHISLLAAVIALASLLYYLLYVFTGKQRLIVPVAMFYVGCYALLVYYVTASAPVDVQVNRWNASLEYAQPITGPLFTAVLVLLVFPQILGALAYGTLYFRVKERTQRYRIALVSVSIIVWFGSTFAAASTGLSQSDTWQLASRAIGLSAAIAILLAYKPPRWVRRRLGVDGVAEEPEDQPGPRASARSVGA